MLGNNLEIFILILGIAIGSLQCFFGYRTFKIMLFATGFLLGFWAGTASYGQPAHNGLYTFILGIAGGILGAALMGALYFVGLFILGASFGGILGVALYTLFQSSPQPLILGVLGLILGFLTVKFQKFMIILVTAFEGAWLMVVGIALLLQLGFISPDPYYFFYPVSIRTEILFPVWLFLALAGFMYQYKRHYLKNHKTLKNTF